MDFMANGIGALSECSFSEKYEALFARLYKKIASNHPSRILFIARKGPRLVDFFEDIVNPHKCPPVIISDRAIPFLDFESIKGEDVPVVDDIVIYGSTVKTVYDKLDEVGVVPKAYCLVYDVDKAKFRDVKAGKFLSHEHVVGFCHDIADAFSLLGIPYDIDHPIFFLHDVSMQQIGALRSAVNTLDITTSLQRNFGILNLVSYSEPVLKLDELFNSENCEFYISLYKTRVYYSIRKSRLCIVPIVLFQLSVKDIHNSIFSFDYLNEITQKALKILEKNKLPSNEIEEAIYRLTFYIVEYICGLLFLGNIQNIFNKDLDSMYTIRKRDVNLLFGESFGKFLVEMLESKKKSMISALLSSGKGRLAFRTEEIKNKKLYTELFESIDYKDLIDILLWNNDVNCVWNICRLMQRKDVLSRDPENIIRDRLRFGFTFDDFLRIILNKYPNLSSGKLSIIFDYFIDKGALVPLFLKYPTGYYVRVFRFGESINNVAEKKRAYFMKNALNFLFGMTKLKSVSQFDLEKLFSYLHDLFKSMKIPLSKEGRTSYETLEIMKGYDEFGARVYSPAFFRMEEKSSNRELHPHGTKPLIQEALQNQLLMKTPEGRFELGDPKTTDILYPPDSDPLMAIHADILLYVRFFVDLCYNGDRPHKRKDEVELVLTTCNDPSNFLATYRVGIYSWFEHSEVRFTRILNSAKLLVQQQIEDKGKWTELDALLHDLATRVKQCKIKNDIWKKAPLIVGKIDHWSKLDAYREGLWLKIRRSLIDLTYFSEKDQIIYDHLFWLYQICRLSATVLRSALTHHGFVPQPKDVGSFEDYIKAFNKFLEAHENVCSLKKIPEDLVSRDRYESLRILVELLDHNSDKLYGKFNEIKQFEKEEIMKVKNFNCDMAITKYDLKGYSDGTRNERNRITRIIDKHMKPYLDSLGEGKYYNSVFNDENCWPISTTEKALKASQKLLAILRAEGKQCRIAIHYTSPNNRIQIYKGETGEPLGGDPFIVVSRLLEVAEEIQKKREKISNVIFLSEDAYANLPEKLKMKGICKSGPCVTSVQGKSIGRIRYYEIDEVSLKRIFAYTGNVFDNE